mgnify:CR=1 FL=1
MNPGLGRCQACAFASRLRQRRIGVYEFPDVDELRDPKTRLQEWMQARQMGLPDYELLDVTGKAHRQVFRVVCRVQERETMGSGTTRRNAEQQAAGNMLAQLKSGGAP